MKIQDPIKRLSIFLSQNHHSMWNETIEKDFVQSSLNEIRSTLKEREKIGLNSPTEMFLDVYDKSIENQALDHQKQNFNTIMK